MAAMTYPFFRFMDGGLLVRTCLLQANAMLFSFVNMRTRNSVSCTLSQKYSGPA